MTFQSSRFDMSSVMNKLRSIAEAEGTEDQSIQAHAKSAYHEPGMEVGGKEIDDASFSRTMQRLNAIRAAVDPEHFDSLKAGVRAMYMNRRPSLQQMSALMDLLETVLTYVSEDTSLFQRLKTDLSKDTQAEKPEPNQEIGAPTTATEPPEQPTTQEPAAGMRDMK